MSEFLRSDAEQVVDPEVYVIPDFVDAHLMGRVALFSESFGESDDY